MKPGADRENKFLKKRSLKKLDLDDKKVSLLTEKSSFFNLNGMNQKTRQLLNKMILGRLIILMILNLIVGSLLILNVILDAKIAVAVLLMCLDAGAIIYIRKQYKKVLLALGLPSTTAQVTLRGHSMKTLDTPNEYQTALIQYLGNETHEQKSCTKVEIGMSSVAIPNMTDTFTAKIFMKDMIPVLILNEDLGILATISWVFKEAN